MMFGFILYFGIFFLCCAKPDTAETEIPPIQWGDPGLRECMLETAERWPKHHWPEDRESPSPLPEFSTYGPRVRAFPGAEGFGAYTFGGRGGKLYRVTNLNDSGPGSFREAVEAEGPRIVIFDVSGTIKLKKPIHVGHPYLTIAGQTAPGESITVARRMFFVSTYDVIIRHLRFRLGDYRGHVAEKHWYDWSFFLHSANHVILDHITITWGISGNLVVQRSDNVTVQNSILAKPIWDSYHRKGVRGYGALIRGRYGARYSLLRNLWANNRARVPRPGNYLGHEEDPYGLLMDFRNNVIYEGIGANYDPEAITEYNFVNNYYLTNWRLIDRSSHTRGHFSGNYRAGSQVEDQWSLVDPGANVSRVYHEQLEPFEAGDVTTLSAPGAWKQVMANAGPLVRDSHDENVFREVINYYYREIEGQGNKYTLPDWWKTGRIDSQDEVGGLPELESVTIPEWIDTNRNGIPDWWEQAHGLDSGDPGIANIDSNGNGYTNIEDYFNDMDAIRLTHKMVKNQNIHFP